MADEANGADVDVSIAGQHVSFKNVKSLNTIATVATLMLVAVLGYAFYTHASETKDAGRELVQALKEMTQATRESNCINTFPVEKRADNADLCKRLSR